MDPQQQRRGPVADAPVRKHQPGPQRGTVGRRRASTSVRRAGQPGCLGRPAQRHGLLVGLRRRPAGPARAARRSRPAGRRRSARRVRAGGRCRPRRRRAGDVTRRDVHREDRTPAELVGGEVERSSRPGPSAGRGATGPGRARGRGRRRRQGVRASSVVSVGASVVLPELADAGDPDAPSGETVGSPYSYAGSAPSTRRSPVGDVDRHELLRTSPADRGAARSSRRCGRPGRRRSAGSSSARPGSGVRSRSSAAGRRPRRRRTLGGEQAGLVGPEVVVPVPDRDSSRAGSPTTAWSLRALRRSASSSAVFGTRHRGADDDQGAGVRGDGDAGDPTRPVARSAGPRHRWREGARARASPPRRGVLGVSDGLGGEQQGTVGQERRSSPRRSAPRVSRRAAAIAARGRPARRSAEVALPVRCELLDRRDQPVAVGRERQAGHPTQRDVAVEVVERRSRVRRQSSTAGSCAGSGVVSEVMIRA